MKPIDITKNNIQLDIGRGEILLLPQRENLIGGLSITQKFSSPDEHPYDSVLWEKKNITIFDFAKNRPSFSRENVEVPSHWADNAIRITASKYLFGSNPEDPEYEDSLRHPFDRIANTYTVWGWKNGYFATLEDAKAFNWELKAMLVGQIWAPNSPVWFNLGHWEQYRWGRPDLRERMKGKGNRAFKAFRNGDDLDIQEFDNVYIRPQSSACFLTEIEDSMESILHHQIAEGRIFASGSGAGMNLSNMRSSYEPIAGRGRSSGPLSFDKGWDRMAGAIKSGGRCLAPWQKIYTETGPMPVSQLAEKGGHFVCLSYDAMAGRIMAKPAQAWMEGIKNVVEIITDKGTFALSDDHSTRTADFQIIEAGKLKPGMHLHAGSVDMGSGYLRVHLQNGKKGKEKFHRLIARDILGDKIAGMHVHHIDGDKLNNRLENLETITQNEHNLKHSAALVAAGTHQFQLKKYPKLGSKNPMHSSAPFWTSENATRYKKLQGKLLKESGRATAMQQESSAQRMLNKLWETANAGGDISTFESYFRDRTRLIGRIDAKKRLKADINKYFGSYEGMLEEMSAKNHTVIAVRKLGPMETYNVEVKCPSPDDKTAASGHNFLIWDNNNEGITGSGIFVLNSRRAARMCLLNSDHPDIFDWINLKNSQEEIAKVILREHNTHIELKKLAQEKLKSKNPAEQIAASFILALPLVNEKSYAGDMDGEIYGETISNQNANHSVSLKGDFWKAYYANGDYSTRWVTKPDKIHATFRAKELLEAMARSVYYNAEPGSHNSDFINLWNPVKSIGRITTSNPCCFTGETMVGTVDGPYSFKYLAEQGTDVQVYCQDPTTGRTHVRRMWGIEIKRKNVPITKVTFEDGSWVRCTHDERFLTLDGTYVQAEDCMPGQKLRPFLMQNPKEGPTVGTTIIPNLPDDQQHREVTKVEPDGEEDVYDGTVDEFHNFAVLTSGHCEEKGCLHIGFFAHNSEYFHLTGTSCNLSSLNAFRFLENGTINIEKLSHGAFLAMICADLNIEECGFPIPEIAEGTYLYRSTGVGYGNLGGLLMALGIPYDSDEGRYIAGLLMSHLTASCWKASAMMGKEFGPYLKYEQTKNDLHEVLRLHQACHELLVEMPKLNGNREKTDAAIASLMNTFKPLPVSDNLTGADALKGLVASFENKGEWDQAWLKIAEGLVAADPWDGLGDESLPLRNSFVSLLAPGGCLVANSMVLTETGLKRIRRMGNPTGEKWQSIGTQVQTDQGPKLATKFFLNGKAETRIIRTERLHEMQGTGKHRAKRLNWETLELEWVRLADACTKDTLAIKLGGMFGNPQTVWLPKLPALHCNNNEKTKVPEVLTEELAEFLGLFCGDGSLHSRGVRIAVTNEDPDLMVYISELGKELFGVKGDIRPKQNGNHSVSVVFNSTPLSNWFAAAGFQKHSGTRDERTKKPAIPDAVLESNNPKIYGAFLRGLAEADGTFRIGSLPTIGTHHRPFAQEIMVMMCALGIAPTMDDSTKSGFSGKTLYRVSLQNHDYLPAWRKLCGFISDRKIEKQNTPRTYSFSRNDLIPIHPLWLKKAKQATRNKSRLACGIRKGQVTKNTAREIIKLENGSELGRKLTALLDYIFDPVLENLDGGTQETFDLSVPENVTYIANGFVSHNTISAPLGIYDEGTTSAEPDYTLVKYKVLSGGGTITMFNSLALKGLKTLGYSEFQVKEAALEVAGINGLIIACNGDVNSATKHLSTTVAEDQCGPVRNLFLNTPLPAGGSVTELVGSLAYGKPNDIPPLLAEGASHMEFIPWLSEHHLPVFDCASTAKEGTRSIAPTGHIRMLGALQPFLSGSTSKTVNLPDTATEEDILHCFEDSHKMGVKCIALYRNGSKGVSVFSGDTPDSRKWKVENIWNETVKSVDKKMVDIVAKASLPKRHKLPGRRWSQIVKFEIASQTPMEGFLIVGIYPDGRCGEVFGRLGQGGSFGHGMFESFCKSFSGMLQWGVPLDKAISMFRATAFDPAGWTSVYDPDSENGKADIKSCRSVVDLMMQILAWMFPEERGNRIRSIESNQLVMDNASVTFESQEEEVEVKPKKVDFGAAEQCPSCSAMAYIQDGKCKRCRSCDYSGGGCG